MGFWWKLDVPLWDIVIGKVGMGAGGSGGCKITETTKRANSLIKKIPFQQRASGGLLGFDGQRGRRESWACFS